MNNTILFDTDRLQIINNTVYRIKGTYDIYMLKLMIALVIIYLLDLCFQIIDNKYKIKNKFYVFSKETINWLHNNAYFVFALVVIEVLLRFTV